MSATRCTPLLNEPINFTGNIEGMQEKESSVSHQRIIHTTSQP